MSAAAECTATSVVEKLSPELEEVWRRSKWEYFKEKFVADPSRDYYYVWLGIVSLAYVYNLFAIVFRCVFLFTPAVQGNQGKHVSASSYYCSIHSSTAYRKLQCPLARDPGIYCHRPSVRPGLCG